MKRSPFEFDISVGADKKRRAQKRGSSRGMSGASDTSTRVCDAEGCNRPAPYRAPKSSDKTDEFFWFCKEHIREYNLKWNYFQNHSDAELEEQLNKDKVWERPTRPLKDRVDRGGDPPEDEAWARFGVSDPMEVLGANATQNPGFDAEKRAMRRLPPTERRAVEILDARPSWTKAEIRKQYKALVKDLHPDMNGGRRDDEDRLREVVWAWDQIKGSRSFKD